MSCRLTLIALCAHACLALPTCHTTFPQVICLQDRSSGYLTELDELKAARSSRSLLALPAPAGASSSSQAGSAAAAAATARSAAADKELMLRQIDSLKEVRRV
jgi:hypothetical protein